MPTATVIIESRSTKVADSHRLNFNCSLIELKNEFLDELAKQNRLDSIVTIIEENLKITPASILPHNS